MAAVKVLKTVLGQAWGWCRTRLWPRVAGFLSELWHAFTLHRLRNAFALLVLAAMLAVAIPLLPAVYGRFALAHAAGLAARQVRLKGEDRVLWELRRQAFTLGLTEGALEPDVFKLESGSGEDGTTCTVAYDFIHRVHVVRGVTFPLRCKARITRLVVEPLPNELPEAGEPQ